MADTPRYTLTELAGLAGVTTRTVRYYMAQGLLPAVGTAGPGVKYGDVQLARLRLIRRLQRDHLPLAAIRQQVERLDDATVLSLAEPAAPPPADSALDYVRRVMRSTASAPAASAPRSLRIPASPASASPASASPAALPPEPHVQRAQWERITLAPDIELHVRRPLPRTLTKRVDRLIAIARDLFEEDQP